MDAVADSSPTNLAYSHSNKKKLDNYEILSNLKIENENQFCVSMKLAKDKLTNELVAIKKMCKESILSYSTKEILRKEIYMLKNINHPHIIRLYNYFEDKEYVYFVLEYAENSSLYKYLRRKTKLAEEEAFVYFFQTCLGIDFLHKQNIVYGSLKVYQAEIIDLKEVQQPENLVLDHSFNIKLNDFGWSFEENKRKRMHCLEVDYLTPEIINNQKYDQKSDIWCLGILLYELVHAVTPFDGLNNLEKCRSIANLKSIYFDPNLTPEIVDLIKKILKSCPNERISMKEIFEHSWIKRYEEHFQFNIKDYVVQVDTNKNNEKLIIEEPTKLHSNSKSSTLDTSNNNISCGDFCCMTRKSYQKEICFDYLNSNQKLVDKSNTLTFNHRDYSSNGSARGSLSVSNKLTSPEQRGYQLLKVLISMMIFLSLEYQQFLKE